MMKLKALLGFIVILMLFTVPAWSQLGRATITGTITDASGAIIPGASVVAVNQDTGVQFSGVSNDVGIYRVMDLPIGHYSLSFKKAGFQTLGRTGITLTIGQVAEINITMKVGEVTQSVEVTAAAPILQSQTVETGGAMSNRAYEALPLNISGGRDIQQFAIATVPSVEGNTWTTYVAGEQAFSSQVLIDGTLSHEQETGELDESNPPMAAVEEFKVDTGGQSGQAGMYTGGSTFEFQLKSGTNQFHGSAEGFLQNEALDANSFTNNFDGTPRARNRRDDMAFAVGGPVWIPKIYNGKNKTFFFFAWEREKQSDFTPSGLEDTVPTSDFMNGNFSALLGAPILDSNSNPIYVQDTNGNTAQLAKGMIFDPASPGEVFPGNQIPTSRFSSVAQQLLPVYQKYYVPLVPGIKNNYTTTATNNPVFTQKNWSLKMDQNFSAKDRMAGSFIKVDRPRELNDTHRGPFSMLDPTGYGGPFGATRFQVVTTRAWRLNETHIFSPNVLNVAALTYERFGNDDVPNSNQVSYWPTSLFPTSSQPDIFVSFGNSVNGVGENGIGASSSSINMSESFVVDDNLTWMKGRHTLTFGGEYRAFQMNTGGPSGGMTYNFSNDQTGMPTNSAIAPYVGFGFASFLLGDVQSANMGIPPQLYGRRKSFSLYAADSFHVNNRLTVNYGLNWNYTLPYHEKYGRWANFDQSYVNPATGEPGIVDYLSPSPTQLTGGGKTFETKEYWWDFAPHLGFAYKITPRIVARVGYSMFYMPNGTDSWSGTPYGFAPGYFPTNNVLEPSNFTPAFNWDNGYPGQNVFGTLDPNYLNWGMVTVNPHDLMPAINNVVNAGVQIGLTANTRLTVNYLGTRGIHLKDGTLQENQTSNSAYAKLMASGTEWNWVSDPASAAAAGVPYPYQGYSGYAFQALAPFPQVAAVTWGPIFNVGSPLGWSKYNAFQAEVTHRTSGGLTMDMSYTFARNQATFIPNGGVGGSNFLETWVNTSALQDIYDLSAAANNIQPYNENIVKGYVLYSLPFGKGRAFLSNGSRWVDGLVSGWTIGTVLGYYTGTPLGVYSSDSIPGLYSGIYSMVAPGADLSRHFVDSSFDPSNPADPNNMYFDPSGFANPSSKGEFFGNSGPYVAGLNNFGSASEDAELSKDFALWEHLKTQLRIEYFDVFNRHYFDGPDTNIADSLFGQVTSVQGTHRVGQVSLRFQW
jgi:Carboxypeptidase regulatory-like domain